MIQLTRWPPPTTAQTRRSTIPLSTSPPRSTPAGAARAWSSGGRPAPQRRRGAFRARTTGPGRSPASAIPKRSWRSSAWRRRRTAPTAPVACSPATARATGSTPRCTAPATRVGPARVAGAVQRGVEPVARAVAGEHATGAVGAVRRRRQADDRQLRFGIAEAGDRPGPVVLALKAPRRRCGAGLPPLDQARAAPAGVDLGGEVLKGIVERRVCAVVGGGHRVN